jgi:hypothetical protein
MVSRRASDGNSANLSLINSESIQNNNVNDTKEPPPPYLLDKIANDSETASNQGQSKIDNPHALQPTSCSALLRVHQAPTDLMTTMHFQDYSLLLLQGRERERDDILRRERDGSRLFAVFVVVIISIILIATATTVFMILGNGPAKN